MTLLLDKSPEDNVMIIQLGNSISNVLREEITPDRQVNEDNTNETARCDIAIV